MVLDLDLNSDNLKESVHQKPKPIAIEHTEETNKKPKKKNIALRLIIFLLLLAIVGFIGYFFWKTKKISKDIGFKFNPVEIITTKKPELKKDTNGKFTNILLIGVDSREGNFISNTDTLIVASYDYEAKNFSMISIPRDFHVEIDPKTKWYARINAVYASAESKKEGDGFNKLTKTVEDVTGLEIQYYAMVDFKAFVEIVDVLGGISVNVENSFVDYMYPSGLKYKTVKFTAGPQIMDGKTALEFSRSRHSRQNNEGTDYARARRQQKVIAAIQEKIVQSDTLKDPKAIMGIFSSLVNNIKVSEFTVTDIQAALNLLEDYKDENKSINSFVLEPSVGDKTLVERKNMPNGAFAIGPVEGLGQYTKIHEYIQVALKRPKLYSENPTIYVYDIGLGATNIKTNITEIKEEYPYISIIQSYTLFKDKEGIYVYSNEEKYPETISEFSKYLKTNNNTKPEFIKNGLAPTGVIILVGKTTQLEETTGSEI
ncbi:MAG TPA: LCP family protein [Candidatus Pacearchaeota archaeon]|nr:LCP family protein [Candidatus Pacearchaeota archaeon]